MSMKRFCPIVLTALLLTALAAADTLTLNDGTVLKDCYVRDEGVRLTVWKSLKDVAGQPEIFLRSVVKDYKVERGPDWDKHPELPDLSVTFVEITPKLAGLHGRVQYDDLGRPWIAGESKLLVDMGDRKFTDPEGAAKNLKLAYQPGEELTLVAHVKNLGFADAKPFQFAWFITPEDSRAKPAALETGKYDKPLKEMEEATFTLKWKWQPGRQVLRFKITTEQPEITVINNEAVDALWAWPYTYVVSKGRVNAWHTYRSAYGTFSFEDFYRWHIDIMNLLFENSVFPATPKGCLARVRLDRIIYADRVEDNDPVIDGKRQSLFSADGIRYDQGGWSWNDSKEELDTGKFIQIDADWRNHTEWSLPHELGHQLGLVDWYNVDYEGVGHHTWPDSNAKVSHFQRYPMQMMHSHGPQVYGEADAAYFNYTLDKPRGHFGDYYFALPEHIELAVVDINGQPLPGAQVDVFQRGTEVDPKGQPTEDPATGAKFFPVIEDGNFDKPVSKDPVISGQTNADGRLVLPNRPVAEVKTLNGFHRRPNPFGNLNVVGNRCLLLIRVVKDNRTNYYWLEGGDGMIAWFRGHKERYTVTLRTPLGSSDSPPPPAEIEATKVDDQHVKVTWTPPKTVRERNYLHEVIGYRVYRRFANDGLNDRPWLPVATLGPKTLEFVVDLRELPADTYWYQPQTLRFGVTSLATGAIESELKELIVP